MKHTVSAEHAVVLQDVENTAHLTEYEDSGSLSLHSLQELVEDDHLAGVLDEVLIGGIRRTGFLS